MIGAIGVAAMHAVVAGGPVVVRPRTFGFPADATIVEARPLPKPARQDRALVLWMRHPTRHPRVAPDDEAYTCREHTRGSYLSGPTRVSLLDLAKHRVVNTLVVRAPETRDDTFDVPYRIWTGAAYRVEGATEHEMGKPTVFASQDVNGDGKALEFPLFDAADCMTLWTALVGYSERRDAVIQYGVRLGPPGGRKQRAHGWVVHLFDTAPLTRRHWVYDVDYSGRGGCRESYDIRYDPKSETFLGTVAESECERW